MAGIRRRAAGLLLAAGASTRMGTPKALLSTRSGPLIVHQVRAMCAVGLAPIVVVLGCRATELQHVLAAEAADVPHWRVVVNHRWEEGKCGSIRAGALDLVPTQRDIVIAAVDQPLAAEIVQALWGFHLRRAAVVTLPQFLGRGGHPVVLRADVAHRLTQLTEATFGLRGLMRDLEAKHPGAVLRVDLNSSCVLQDLNRPSDLPARFRLPAEGPPRARSRNWFCTARNAE